MEEIDLSQGQTSDLSVACHGFPLVGQCDLVACGGNPRRMGAEGCRRIWRRSVAFMLHYHYAVGMQTLIFAGAAGAAFGDSFGIGQTERVMGRLNLRDRE
jgi:hypothetical protein